MRVWGVVLLLSLVVVTVCVLHVLGGWRSHAFCVASCVNPCEGRVGVVGSSAERASWSRGGDYWCDAFW
eukprot:196352-Prorocentrum_lima.AAC.1